MGYDDSACSFTYIGTIYKIIRGAGVHYHEHRSEVMRVHKSGHIETNLLGGTILVTATFQSYKVRKVTGYFFVSVETSSLVSRVAVVAQPLAAQEVDIGQSLVMCPASPQNMQSLLSKQCCLSLAVSLPSFPNFDIRSGLVAAVMTKGLVGLAGSLKPFRDVGMDAEEGMGFFLEDVCGFTCQLILDLCSQQHRSIA